VNSVAFSPDGKTLASGSGDVGTISLLDVATGKEQATLEGRDGRVTSVAYSPDGKTLASGNWDGTIKLWDVATGKEQATLKGHTNWVNSVAFSPDGKTLASGGGASIAGEFKPGEVNLWDVATGKERATLKGHTIVVSVAFSSDGKTLASGSYDKTIKLWDVAKPEMVSVPNVIGLPVNEAAAKFQEKKLEYKENGQVITGKVPIGAIASQSPAAEGAVRVGTKVMLAIEANSVEVPSLIGKTVGQALGDIRSLKLNDVIEGNSRGEIIMGDPVVRQSPEPGTRVAPGAKVTISAR
jgi:dipeptidyl aminopeptidase/acylaminoacyl peptidase